MKIDFSELIVDAIRRKVALDIKGHIHSIIYEIPADKNSNFLFHNGAREKAYEKIMRLISNE